MRTPARPYRPNAPTLLLCPFLALCLAAALAAPAVADDGGVKVVVDHKGLHARTADGDFEFALTAEISNDALGLLAEAARQSISGSLEEL